MGHNHGVIWNNSDFPIQYLIYGAFQELGTTHSTTKISPRSNLNLPGGSFSLQGFQHVTSTTITPKYEESFVEISPGRYSSVGLTDLKWNKHKISLRIKVGDYVKYLVKDVVVKSAKDIRLKVRRDLSIKNLGQEEAEELIRRNLQRSEDRLVRENRQKTLEECILRELQAIRVQ